MSQQRSTLLLGALNIVATPHPLGTYDAMIKSMVDIQVHAYGSDFAVIANAIDGSLYDAPNIRFGQIFLFTELQTGSWFDIKAKNAATADLTSQIVIPENLRPNFKPFSYFFNLENHTFYFERRNEFKNGISHARVKRIVDEILHSPSVAVQYPETSVAVIPKSDALEKVFSIPHLKKLKIRIERPNDDIGEEARQVMERMQMLNAKRQDFVLTNSEHAASLVVDPSLMTLARVGSRNGFVSGSGVDEEGTRMHAQTTNYPADFNVPLTDSDDPLDAFFAWMGFPNGK